MSSKPPPPVVSRLTPDEARERLEEILLDGRIHPDAFERVRSLTSLDAWPPAEPMDAALSLLDPDEAPEPDDAPASALFKMAGILLDLAEHYAFEAGRAAERAGTVAPDSDEDAADTMNTEV